MNHRYPRTRRIVLWLVVPFIVLGSGCAANSLQLHSPDSPCQELVKRVVRGIAKGGVVDAQARPIDGFPLFRVDRFHAAVTDSELQGPEAKRQWVAGLSALGIEGLLIELARLPPNQRPAKPAQVKRCAAQRSDQILQSTALFQRLRSAAKVPDSYSRTKQIVGLYALTSWPVKRGVTAWHEETAARYQIDMPSWLDELPVQLYQVNTAQPPVHSSGDVTQVQWLQHAPSLLVQQREQDKIGHFVRRGNRLAFDDSYPVAYVMESKTRFQGDVLQQLNYLFWVEGRARRGALDILAGELDGLQWRVTLDVDGEPLIYDSIHPCGCYHLFFPTERLGRKNNPPDREPALIPQIFAAPINQPLLRVTSTSHYIEGVSPRAELALNDVSSAALEYGLVDYKQLRAMGSADQAAISLFNNKGLVDGTQRLERFMLWMSGIKSPGAMRQWGHQATAFFGRRHFDDADLLDSEFCRVGDDGCMPLKTSFD